MARRVTVAATDAAAAGNSVSPEKRSFSATHIRDKAVKRYVNSRSCSEN